MCRTDDDFGKNVLTCTFFMHDDLVEQEIRDGLLFVWRGELKILKKNCLQNQKSPNKLFADMKRRK